MKTILWAQNEDALTKDTFVIDNIISQYSDDDVHNTAFSMLTKASENLRLSPFARRNLSDLLGFSEQANFSITDCNYYIQGCFEEKDNRGRYMPYMFLATDCNSLETAISILKETANTINRTCKQFDLDWIAKFADKDSEKIDKAIKKAIRNRSKKKIPNSTILTILIAVSILFLILWLALN